MNSNRMEKCVFKNFNTFRRDDSVYIIILIPFDESRAVCDFGT